MFFIVGCVVGVVAGGVGFLYKYSDNNNRREKELQALADTKSRISSATNETRETLATQQETITALAREAERKQATHGQILAKAGQFKQRTEEARTELHQARGQLVRARLGR